MQNVKDRGKYKVFSPGTLDGKYNKNQIWDEVE